MILEHSNAGYGGIHFVCHPNHFDNKTYVKIRFNSHLTFGITLPNELLTDVMPDIIMKLMYDQIMKNSQVQGYIKDGGCHPDDIQNALGQFFEDQQYGGATKYATGGHVGPSGLEYPSPLTPLSAGYAANYLPGVKMLVKHPLKPVHRPLIDVIINLNDYHKWSREEIADWLDTLDLDLEFK